MKLIFYLIRYQGSILINSIMADVYRTSERARKSESERERAREGSARGLMSSALAIGGAFVRQG